MKHIQLLMPAVLGVSFIVFLATNNSVPPAAKPVAAPAAAAVVQVDETTLMKDVQTLASAAYAGRHTGTEGSKLAQAYLAERFRQIGLAPFGESYARPFSFTHQEGKGPATTYPAAVNVIGHIRGSKYPERVMVVSAHYDHLGTKDGVIYAGADDNASGVGAMLAVASHFKAHPPQNTIVFAAFDGEELNKGGSYALLAAPPFPVEQIKFNLNLDMVSRNDKNEIFASGTSYTPSLKPLVEQVASGSTLKVRLGHDRPAEKANGEEDWTGSSDHGPFHEAGIPFLYLGVEDHADYHKGSDTADKIKPAFYTETTRLIIRLAEKLDQNLEQIKK